MVDQKQCDIDIDSYLRRVPVAHSRYTLTDLWGRGAVTPSSKMKSLKTICMIKKLKFLHQSKQDRFETWFDDCAQHYLVTIKKNCTKCYTKKDYNSFEVGKSSLFTKI